MKKNHLTAQNMEQDLKYCSRNQSEKILLLIIFLVSRVVRFTALSTYRSFSNLRIKPQKNNLTDTYTRLKRRPDVLFRRRLYSYGLRLRNRTDRTAFVSASTTDAAAVLLCDKGGNSLVERLSHWRAHGPCMKLFGEERRFPVDLQGKIDGYSPGSHFHKGRICFCNLLIFIVSIIGCDI